MIDNLAKSRRLSFHSSASVSEGDSSEHGSGRLRSLSGASAEIDLDHINRSLEHVNNYSKRRLTEKLPPVLMYEITSDGESCYKSITLRELLNDVNEEAAGIDRRHTRKPETKRSASAPPLQQDSKPDDEHPPAKKAEHQRRPSGTQPSPALSAAAAAAFEPIAVPPRRSSVQPLAATKSLYEMKYTSGNPSPAIGIGIGIGAERPPSPTPMEQEPAIEVSYDATGSLRLRDLRRLDFQFNPNEERSVLIRRHAVLFAMDPIRAVVMSNRLILIVPDGADSLLSILDQYMKEWVNPKDSPEHPPLHHHPDGTKSDFMPTPRSVGEVITVDKHSTGSNSNLINMGKLLGLIGGSRTATPAPGAGAGANVASGATSAPNSPNAGAATGTANAGTATAGTATAGTGGGATAGAGATANAGAKDEPKEPEPRRERTDYEQRQLANASTVSQNLPFEMHAVEALLTTVMALETLEYNKVYSQVQIILNYFRSGMQRFACVRSTPRHHLLLTVVTPGSKKTAGIRSVGVVVVLLLTYLIATASGSLLPIEVQEKMRNRKNDLSVMMRRIISARQALTVLTEDDEQMALMNLSVLRHKPALYQ
jgi:hypothetical protein